MKDILFFIVLEVLIAESIALLIFYREYKKKTNIVDKLTRTLDEQRKFIRQQRQIIQNLDKQNQVPEHELQGEYEADDKTYNQIIEEWIYGPQIADEEGGTDGQDN